MLFRSTGCATPSPARPRCPGVTKLLHLADQIDTISGPQDPTGDCRLLACVAAEGPELTFRIGCRVLTNPCRGIVHGIQNSRSGGLCPSLVFIERAVRHPDTQRMTGAFQYERAVHAVPIAAVIPAEEDQIRAHPQLRMLHPAVVGIDHEMRRETESLGEERDCGSGIGIFEVGVHGLFRRRINHASQTTRALQV